MSMIDLAIMALLGAIALLCAFKCGWHEGRASVWREIEKKEP